MDTPTCGMTVTYFRHGIKIREYHSDAVLIKTQKDIKVLINKNGQMIASYDTVHSVSIEDHNPQKKKPTNRKADAPDILESLELLVETIETGGSQSAALVIAKAAIAKARGE